MCIIGSRDSREVDVKPDKRELEPTGTGRRFGSRERMNFEVPENHDGNSEKEGIYP